MHRALVLAWLIALPAAANPGSQVARLSWLTGTWAETKGAVTTRETWEASDGALVGTGETLRAGQPPQVTERLKITAEATGATLTATVGGQPPTPFRQVSSGADEVVFENKAHDFPQRIIYRRCRPQLCARIEGMVNGKLEFEEWRFTRVK